MELLPVRGFMREDFATTEKWQNTGCVVLFGVNGLGSLPGSLAFVFVAQGVGDV